MKTVIIDGVEYEVLKSFKHIDGGLTLQVLPIPKPKKTLVEIYREVGPIEVLDAIEERLAALEAGAGKK